MRSNCIVRIGSKLFSNNVDYHYTHPAKIVAYFHVGHKWQCMYECILCYFPHVACHARNVNKVLFCSLRTVICSTFAMFRIHVHVYDVHIDKGDNLTSTGWLFCQGLYYFSVINCISLFYFVSKFCVTANKSLPLSDIS